MRYQRNPSSGKGLALSFRFAGGTASSGGANALLNRSSLEGLGGGSAGPRNARAELGAAYGFPVLGGRFVGVPHARIGISPGGREQTVGYRLEFKGRNGPGFGFGIEAIRPVRADGARPSGDVVFIVASLRW